MLQPPRMPRKFIYFAINLLSLMIQITTTVKSLLNPSLCDKLVVADGIKRSNITVVTLAFARIKLVQCSRNPLFEISSLAIQPRPQASQPQAKTQGVYPMSQSPPRCFSTPKMICDYYKNPGHTKETCYILVVIPPCYLDNSKSAGSKLKRKPVVKLVQEPDYCGIEDMTTLTQLVRILHQLSTLIR